MGRNLPEAPFRKAAIRQCPLPGAMLAAANGAIRTSATASANWLQAAARDSGSGRIAVAKTIASLLRWKRCHSLVWPPEERRNKLRRVLAGGGGHGWASVKPNSPHPSAKRLWRNTRGSNFHQDIARRSSTALASSHRRPPCNEDICTHFIRGNKRAKPRRGRWDRAPFPVRNQGRRPRLFATPAPYAGSAFVQWSTWRSLISRDTSAIARPVLSNSACCWVGFIRRKRAPGWE
jgi:hypothetical protein